ncbi:MAG: hypothetical protein ACT4QA_21485 [Panacagrimonas sp.]
MGGRGIEIGGLSVTTALKVAESADHQLFYYLRTSETKNPSATQGKLPKITEGAGADVPSLDSSVPDSDDDLNIVIIRAVDIATGVEVYPPPSVPGSATPARITAEMRDPDGARHGKVLDAFPKEA